MKIVFEGQDLQEITHHVLKYLLQVGTRVEESEVKESEVVKTVSAPASEADTTPTSTSKPSTKKGADLKVVKNIKIDYDTAFTALKAYNKEHGREAAKQILANHKVSRLSELKDFAAIYAELTA